MLQTQLSRVPREKLTATILEAKAKRNLSFEDLTEHTGLSIAFVTAALFGQHTLPANAAEAVGKQLDLDADDVALLQTIPMRGCSPDGIPTDSTIYRFYDMLQIYGTTLKALINQQFGDGIISAINFKMDIKKVEDPEGGSRGCDYPQWEVLASKTVLRN